MVQRSHAVRPNRNALADSKSPTNTRLPRSQAWQRRRFIGHPSSGNPFSEAMPDPAPTAEGASEQPTGRPFAGTTRTCSFGPSHVSLEDSTSWTSVSGDKRRPFAHAATLRESLAEVRETHSRRLDGNAESARLVRAHPPQGEGVLATSKKNDRRSARHAGR